MLPDLLVKRRASLLATVREAVIESQLFTITGIIEQKMLQKNI